jgi:hypothetical protein
MADYHLTKKEMYEFVEKLSKWFALMENDKRPKNRITKTGGQK